MSTNRLTRPCNPICFFFLASLGESGVARKNNSQEEQYAQDLEIVITGTLVPVRLVLLPDLGASGDQNVSGKPMPGNRLLVELGQCPVGEQRTGVFYLINESQELPIRFRLPRVAHFRPRPQEGHIRPDGRQMVYVDFVPKQYGRFNSGTTCFVNYLR